MSEKPSLKAKLKIVLQANDTVVAESHDPVLWQKVLAVINQPENENTDPTLGKASDQFQSDEQPDKGSISKFAKELGVSLEVIKGACDPSETLPYIHLDKHYWEALKQQTPQRGPKAISPIVLAATLLALWQEKSKIKAITVKDALKTLGTIGLRDNHAQRGLQNCEWLQLRGENIIINPSQTSKAIALAKSYCTKSHTK